MKTNSIRENKSNAFIIMQTITIVILIISVQEQFKDIRLMLNFIAIIACLISYYLLFKICRRILQKARIDAENEILQKQIDIQQEHYEALKESSRQLDSIKQEIIQKMDVSDPSIFENEDATRAYFNTLIQECDSLYNIDYCRNRIVDAILYNKLILAKAKHIQCSVEAILPEVLSIDPLDLMRVYTNLLDNAIEACEKVDTDKRSLRITSHIKAGYLVVVVENSKLEGSYIDLKNSRTTKADEKLHGLGLQIIQSTVLKYEGSIGVEEKGDTIRVNVLMKPQT